MAKPNIEKSCQVCDEKYFSDDKNSYQYGVDGINACSLCVDAMLENLALANRTYRQGVPEDVLLEALIELREAVQNQSNNEGGRMTRKARVTANVLMRLYKERFASESMAPFSLSWSQLRGIAGVLHLSDEYLAAINGYLWEDDYALLSYSNMFLVTREGDLDVRALSAGLAERSKFVQRKLRIMLPEEDDEIELPETGDEADDAEEVEL